MPPSLGRGDAALDPADRLRDVEVGAVQLGDGAVGELPASSRGTPPCPAIVRAGSASSAATASSTVAPGHDPARRPRASRPRCRASSCEAPGVRLVEVDRRAEEVAARPARSAPGRRPRFSRPRGASSVARNRPNSAIAAVAAAARRASSAPQRAVRAAAARPARGRSCRRPSRPVQTSHCLATSTSWPAGGHVAGVGRLAAGSSGSRPARRDRGEPGGDVRPGVVAVGRHQVEDQADLVQPAGDHVDLGLRHPGVVHLELEAEPLVHRLLGDLLALVEPGVAARRGRPARARVSASRAAKPSGERSVSWSSCPAMPT